MKRLLSLLLCVGLLFFFVPVNAAETNTAMKSRLLKIADESAADLFKGSFDHKDTKILKAAEIPKALKKMGVDTGKLPKTFKVALKNKKVMALYVPRMKVQGQGTLKMMGEIPRLLAVFENDMSFSPEGGWAGGYWIANEKPCPDDRDLCERCTGCKNPPKDICVCTSGCACVPCKPCAAGESGYGSVW